MRLTVLPWKTKAYIHPEVYGNFSEHLGRCIYGGVFVGENSPIPNVNGIRTDVVEALKNIRLSALRWPGGCFADEYHWQEGIGPLEQRKRLINTNWGGVVEDNSFGTHEFMELCRQVGCKPYINGNMGSGTVREMADWVEYMTSPADSPMANLRRANGQEAPWKVSYFGVGNESWGCGGNMTAEQYAQEFRRYQTFLHNFGDNALYKIACGPGTSMEAPNYDWTETLMRVAGRYMNGLSLHYYTVPGLSWEHKGSATQFSDEEYQTTIRKAAFMDELLEKHGAIMDRYDPEKRVGLIVDEWGTWYDVEPGTNPGFLYQQNTMRDAVVAAMNLNIFNRHADRVHMANIAQLANVLQSIILTEGEKMVLTPTYHVFDMFKVHQGGQLVESVCAPSPITVGGVQQLSHSASVDKEGILHVTITNLSATEEADVEMFIDQQEMEYCGGYLLRSEAHACNTFEEPEKVKPLRIDFVDLEATDQGTSVDFLMMPCATLRLSFKVVCDD